MWLNEQLIIDNWVDRPAPEASATVNLVAGQRYLLRVEFYENHLYAGIRLRWSSPSTPKQIIPQSQLYSVPTDADGNGLADLWELAYFGRVGVDPNADDDGDGLSNLQKYRRWIDPWARRDHGVPNDWAHGNMGPALGDASYSDGVFTVSSTGRAAPKPVRGHAFRDAFHFLYQPMDGNCQMVARVLGDQRPGRCGGAGQGGGDDPPDLARQFALRRHDCLRQQWDGLSGTAGGEECLPAAFPPAQRAVLAQGGAVA